MHHICQCQYFQFGPLYPPSATATTASSSPGQPMKQGIKAQIICNTVPSPENATGVRLRRSGNNSWPRPNHRQPEPAPTCTRAQCRAKDRSHRQAECCRHVSLDLPVLSAPRLYILALLCLGYGRSVNLWLSVLSGSSPQSPLSSPSVTPAYPAESGLSANPHCRTGLNSRSPCQQSPLSHPTESSTEKT